MGHQVSRELLTAYNPDAGASLVEVVNRQTDGVFQEDSTLAHAIIAYPGLFRSRRFSARKKKT